MMPMGSRRLATVCAAAALFGLTLAAGPVDAAKARKKAHKPAAPAQSDVPDLDLVAPPTPSAPPPKATAPGHGGHGHAAPPPPAESGSPAGAGDDALELAPLPGAPAAPGPGASPASGTNDADPGLELEPLVPLPAAPGGHPATSPIPSPNAPAAAPLSTETLKAAPETSGPLAAPELGLVQPVAPPRSGPSWKLISGIVVAGLGAAGLATSGYFGAQVDSLNNNTRNLVVGLPQVDGKAVCDPALADCATIDKRLQRNQRRGSVAEAAQLGTLAAGGALVAVGGGLMLWDLLSAGPEPESAGRLPSGSVGAFWHDHLWVAPGPTPGGVVLVLGAR